MASRIHRSVWAGLALALATGGCGQGQAEEAPGVSLSEVQRRDLEITAEAAGELEPLRKVEVKSRASGEVVEVLVDSGDRVEPGDLLVRVDPRDVQSDFEQAEADLEVAQERFSIAESQLRRSENLLAAGVITEQEHESRNLEYANARANLVRARTNFELAQVRMDDVTIRSPMHGVVLDRAVEEGTVIQSAAQNVSGGTVLLTIADLDVMQVRTLVDETDVGRIEAEMSATVQVDAFQDRSFQGTVEKVEPQARVESNVVMFPVIVRLDNREGILKPGMSAEVSVLLARREEALTLPNNAIVTFEELAAAGAVLGIPEDRLQLDRSVFQELNRELAARRGQDTNRSGDEAVAARGGGPGGPGGQGMRARPGARRAGGGSGDTRPGVVFVMGPDGQLAPRPVLIGVNDWDASEILVGLEEGEQVALIGGAQLQARQQEQSERMRARMGGRLPF